MTVPGEERAAADGAPRRTGLRLPFFVYGTLRPGGRYHDTFLRGRLLAEEPGLLPDTLLYEGPGYPYAVRAPGAGPVRGSLVTPLPALYARVLDDLDRLEGHRPGSAQNLYDRIPLDVFREAAPSPAVRGCTSRPPGSPPAWTRAVHRFRAATGSGERPVCVGVKGLCAYGRWALGGQPVRRRAPDRRPPARPAPRGPRRS
ncbi:gamma-glutamylcyclotransferase family protein [Streptomyces triticagri]|uniref:gamma-glutamylcyclotransferase family protein n=1 Tax=Streptomyces triticagri TaxID=2293568 RepID=UPI00269CA428|nr:gamma-glutamylcyclotransferase family protein [Streptomyces triticagri]